MVLSPQEARAFIAERSSLHSKANHNCWAYKISRNECSNKQELFSSDDGEPPGTGGKPIIGAIEKSNITNIAVVVSRYFGGHKLGIRGLIDAYSGAALTAIEKSGVCEFRLFIRLVINCGYSEWPRVQYEIERIQIHINKDDVIFKERILLTVYVESEKLKRFVSILDTYQANKLDVDYHIMDNRQYRSVKKIKENKV